jgi:D-serine deaminase-like pyridoxal phosphate-dependent protein
MAIDVLVTSPRQIQASKSLSRRLERSLKAAIERGNGQGKTGRRTEF